jgi:hypothetical protein
MNSCAGLVKDPASGCAIEQRHHSPMTELSVHSTSLTCRLYAQTSLTKNLLLHSESQQS